MYATDPVNEFDLDGNAIPWRKIGKVAVTAAAIGGAIACGASVVCGVAVGVAAGAASYGVSEGGTKQFSLKGVAGSAAVGGLFGSIGTGGSSQGLKAAGGWMSKTLNGGKSRVEIASRAGQWSYDLVGRAHYQKSVGRYILSRVTKNSLFR